MISPIKHIVLLTAPEVRGKDARCKRDCYVIVIDI